MYSPPSPLHEEGGGWNPWSAINTSIQTRNNFIFENSTLGIMYQILIVLDVPGLVGDVGEKLPVFAAVVVEVVAVVDTARAHAQSEPALLAAAGPVQPDNQSINLLGVQTINQSISKIS